MAAKIKNVGKNDKAAEDLAISGEIDLNESFEIDEYAPHPRYTFSKGNTLSQIELGKFPYSYALKLFMYKVLDIYIYIYIYMIYNINAMFDR